ncbi:hypothetical protein K9N68_18210 [Kovacikia minuta CCNUW1]|uniref:hypothetical protein n=1 Tax=Kovacikia minuta TaxID=2931930 RepID=UPI001CCA976E|nr:hypothetical protein [Kovacikia minuta]UBF23705.1 hypothetical protein K9N68_18210 [Kovacikia minuta CCNUW1]
MTWVERVESVKAGIVGALAAGLMFTMTTLINRSLSSRFATLVGVSAASHDFSWLASGAIAVLSGFLFGITYRYVIRQDPNPHLRSGAVLAFGLVRGMAQIDTGWTAQKTLLPFAVLGLESLLLFVAARMLLDWAFCQSWIKPFGMK